MNNKLNILFITQDDPFYIRIFFEEFFSKFRDKVNILGVVICPTMAKKSKFSLFEQMFNFFGPVDFMRMAYRYAVSKIQGKNLENTCKQNDIMVYHEKNPNREEFITKWNDKGIDVLVSIAAPHKFKKKLLGLAKKETINIHHAKLPSYQGMMPNFWQMYHGEKSAGITVHRMNEGIDQGEIILQKEVPIETNEPLEHLIRRTKKMAAHCIIEALDLIATGKVELKPNDISKATYFGFPSSRDVAEFRRRGGRLL